MSRLMEVMLMMVRRARRKSKSHEVGDGGLSLAVSCGIHDCLWEKVNIMLLAEQIPAL